MPDTEWVDVVSLGGGPNDDNLTSFEGYSFGGRETKPGEAVSFTLDSTVDGERWADIVLALDTDNSPVRVEVDSDIIEINPDGAWLWEITEGPRNNTGLRNVAAMAATQLDAPVPRATEGGTVWPLDRSDGMSAPGPDPTVAVNLRPIRDWQGFAVGANSGINSVKDWAGHKLGYKGSVPVEFLAIARANGLNPNDVDQVKVSFDPRVLSEGQVDILAVFVSNEPGQLERIGYKVKVFDPSDFNIPVLGLTYIASQDGINKDPEALERFLRGALKGIQYASEHVDEAVDIVMKYAPQENRDQQKFMLTTELARARTPLTNTYGYGWQTREQWTALAKALTEFQIVTKDVDVSKVYTSQFLERIYSKKN